MNASAYAALSARARPCGGKEFGIFAKNEGSQDGWNAVSEGRVTPGLDDAGPRGPHQEIIPRPSGRFFKVSSCVTAAVM